eukprot:1133903-Rhodomonas_salina.1
MEPYTFTVSPRVRVRYGCHCRGTKWCPRRSKISTSGTVSQNQNDGVSGGGDEGFQTHTLGQQQDSNFSQLRTLGQCQTQRHKTRREAQRGWWQKRNACYQSVGQ